MDIGPQTSTAIKALAIPELFEQMISFLERRSLAKVALVNRYWSDFALDRIWSSVPEIIHLIRILHPLEWIVAKVDFWDLTKDSPGPNWERYNHYARRVRDLEYTDFRTDRRQRGYHFGPAVWALLSSRGPLPSGVHTIRWTICSVGTNVLHLLPLVHPNVKKLVFNNYGASNDARSLHKLFAGLRQIEGFQLEEFDNGLALYDEAEGTLGEWVTPFLATQTDVKRLTMVDSPFGYGPQTIDAIIHFPALRYLSLLWTGTTQMSRINTVLSQLSEGCPLLQELKLTWWINLQRESVPFDFTNLLKWELQVLEIGPTYPADGARPSIEDIQRMGKAWPHLKVFKTNWANRSDGGDDPDVGLPLSSLSLFATFFPELEELSTIFEWTDDVSTAPIVPLTKLRVLPASEWHIPKEKVGETAAYLRDMCPRGQDVLCSAGSNARRANFGAEAQKRYKARRARWETVAALMKGAKAV